MWYLLVLPAICSLIGPLIAVLLARRWIRQQVNELQTAAGAELAKLLAGESCQSATILNAIGNNIGAAAGRSAKASLLADLSHAKRQENSIANEQQLSLIDQEAPGAGSMMAGMGPNRVNKLLKNPLLQLAIQGFLAGRTGSGGNGSEAPNSGNAQSVRDRLRNMQ